MAFPCAAQPKVTFLPTAGNPIAICGGSRYNGACKLTIGEENEMLFWIGLAVLLVGGIVTRAAAKRGDEGEALKKAGIALIFLGTAALLFVLTVNILVWTGRYGVAG